MGIIVIREAKNRPASALRLNFFLVLAVFMSVGMLAF